MRRIILAVTTDRHAGNKMGLMNPDVKLFVEDENGELVGWRPNPTPVQDFLWNLEQDNLDYAIDLAKGDDLIIIDLGDQTHGQDHNEGLISSRLADQWLIAKANWDLWYGLSNLKEVYMVAGTDTHEAGEGSAMIATASAMQAQYPKVRTTPLYHGLLEIAGIRIDCAHHGPMSGRYKHLAGNVATWYLRDLMITELIDGNVPPDLVLRGHYHEYTPVDWRVESKGRWYKSSLTVAPAMSLLRQCDYVRKVTRSGHKTTVGMLFYEIIDGNIIEHPRVQVRDIRTKVIYHG